MYTRRAASHRTSTDSTSSFRRSLLNAILDVLRVTPCAVSAGAVHWLFKLLTGFAAQADSTLTSFVCLELLEFLSSKLATARLREHLSLRARLKSLLLSFLTLSDILFNFDLHKKSKLICASPPRDLFCFHYTTRHTIGRVCWPIKLNTPHLA